MSFWELLALVSASVTILGVFLAIHVRMNNKLLKEESRHTREILERMEKEHAEARKEMAETLRRMDETLREVARGQERIAHLIVAEGEKTRQVVTSHKL